MWSISKKRRVTKNLLYNRILDEIEKTEGRIAIASMTVHIVETPTFEVKIARDSK